MADHIKINDVAPRIVYRADGVQTAFSFPFVIFKAENLQVFIDGAAQTGGFTVTGAGAAVGGVVTFAAAPANGATVALRRNLSFARTSDFQTDGILRAAVLNTELDYIVAGLQQLADDVGRAVSAPVSDISSGLSLPAALVRANKIMAFDVDGAVTALDPTSLITLAAWADNYADEFVGDGVRTAFVLARRPGTRGNTQVRIDGIYQPKRSYTLTDRVVTFAEPPPAGALVEIAYGQALPQADIEDSMARATSSASAADAAAIRAAEAAAVSVTHADDAKGHAQAAAASATAAQDGAGDATARAAEALTNADDAALSAWQAAQSATEAGIKAAAAAGSAVTATDRATVATGAAATATAQATAAGNAAATATTAANTATDRATVATGAAATATAQATAATAAATTATAAATTASAAATTATTAAATVGNAVAAVIGIAPGQVVPAWALYDTP